MSNAPLIDIRPDHLKIVQDILKKYVPDIEVWAFGSRVKWIAKQYSDLDLCVISDQPLDYLVSGGLKDDFSESDLPWKVDVVDWATTSASFRKIIEGDKVVVQKKKLKDIKRKDIGCLLSALDDRITLLHKTNGTLEAIAQALFKSWFVDFDPVHAKQQGLVPDGMDETTSALFPNSFEESELGLVPKGWRWTILSDAYAINPQRKIKKGEIAPYLDMASVATNGHCTEPAIQREVAKGSKFTNGDTLLARITPCLENGKSAFVDFLSENQNGWGSTEFLVLRPKPPFPEYHAYLLCRDKTFRDFAVQSMSGTSGRQRIQTDVLGRYPLVLPTEGVMTAFANLVISIQQGITANHIQSQTLSNIRDTLLPHLISGQLRLPEAEAMPEEALSS